MIDKYESRRVRAEVRRVLLDVWDPIGVKDEPNAQDEYDCCLGSLFNLLTTGATDDQIAEYDVPNRCGTPTDCAPRRLKLTGL
jgi:hypothetical protein